MKALLLPTKACSELLRILREHFISENTNVFMSNLSNISRVDLFQSTELQAQVHLQICKIFLDNLYRYFNERRLSDFIKHTMHNQIGMALFVEPKYATEILKPLYEGYIPLEDHQEVENDLQSLYYSYINLLYMRDSDRLNRVLHETMMLMIELIPSNIQVIRFELAPNMAPMLCYVDKVDPLMFTPQPQFNQGMMQPSFA